MNKNNISWIHYIYATITASVLAYVTAMDYSDKQADDTSAVDMLPPIFNENENEDKDENENENENEPPSDLYQDNSQLDNSSIYDAVDYEPPIAYPIESNSDESNIKNGGKLKKKKTKSKYITPKNNKTRSRK